MRLAQDEGVHGDELAEVTVTYDLSCPFGVTSPECPKGSVHNVNKSIICERAASQLIRLRGLHPSSAVVTEGPRAVKVTASKSSGGGSRTTGSTYNVHVTFEGGTGPLSQRGTQYCAKCCTQEGPGDFDASADGGATFVNGTSASVSAMTATFSVDLPSPPTHVRYTANQGFPQCAVYNQEGLPAYPFALAVATADGGELGSR